MFDDTYTKNTKLLLRFRISCKRSEEAMVVLGFRINPLQKLELFSWLEFILGFDNHGPMFVDGSSNGLKVLLT